MVNIWYISHSLSARKIFLETCRHALDTHRQTCEQIFLADDFMTEETDRCLCEFLTSFDSEILVQDGWISFSQTVWAVFIKKQ